ncbi:hypothetical protein [Marinibactrum halimedae]|uniref:Lipoprotein n=1 Tax=Marinibactrum halimedae TaxID=1444977 RepID=A0AA37T5U3_9GAMM|nr:hypothetical protein [Marinibactrum halimedae]MCD9457549.1 hypothetical protein [Marinibactrum halimedae]GLS25397.1 hypothetical protein GCM10007877_11110 [Marinibactrum halimedae]
MMYFKCFFVVLVLAMVGCGSDSDDSSDSPSGGDMTDGSPGDGSGGGSNDGGTGGGSDDGGSGGGDDDSGDDGSMDDPDNDMGQKVMMYISKGVIQCEFEGYKPEETAEQLTEAGLEVTASTCGEMTGVSVPDACGSGTTQINLHEVEGVRQDDAESMGFAPVYELIDERAGTGYVEVPCS